MKTKKCPACGAEFGPEIGFCAHDGTRLVDIVHGAVIDHDPLIGRQIGGRYRLLKRIGEGGMGVVYLAEHEAIEKKVAIKVLKEQYAQREDVVARFQQEAKSASRVKHQGVLEVFDFGRTEDHRFFLAMELLDGTDLANTLEAEGSLEPRRAVAIALQVARALAAAHSKGVVHRDLKPENIFTRVDELGREHVKIVDFGIAQLRAEGEESIEPTAKRGNRKLTKTGMIFGTPEYMSPEQASGKNIDQRVDIYALGIILFELLTGRTPFQGETFLAILNAHVMEPIPSLAAFAPRVRFSRELEHTVQSALAKDPEGRYRTMGDFAEALLHTPESHSEGGNLARPLSAAPNPLEATQPAGNRPPLPAKISVAPPAGRAFDASAATMLGDANDISAPPPPRAPQISHSTEATISPAYDAPKKGGGTAVFVAVAVVLLGGGAFAAYRTLSGGEPPKVAATASAPPPSVTAAAPPPAASPSPSVSAEPTTVVIHVETTPAGAIVEREVGKDWVQVCSETPCDVKVTPGTPVHLRATKGAAVGDKKLIADHDQKAQLALATPTIKPVASAKAVADLCEVMSEEGIKVWRPCPKK